MTPENRGWERRNQGEKMVKLDDGTAFSGITWRLESQFFPPLSLCVCIRAIPRGWYIIFPDYTLTSSSDDIPTAEFAQQKIPQRNEPFSRPGLRLPVLSL